MTDMLQAFEGFKADIDQHHDRRERLIKTSRDITALSKKIIFCLHRIPILPIKTGKDAVPDNIRKEIEVHEKQIERLAHQAASDLQHANAWRYQRNISGAIQEYVEAITFRYYIEHQAVPTLQETQELVGSLSLTSADYILGLADLTGELARRAIAALAFSSPQILEYNLRISNCLRTLAVEFEGLDAGKNTEGLKELGKKIPVMHASVKKVELGVFDKCIRGTERPEGWVTEKQDESRD